VWLEISRPRPLSACISVHLRFQFLAGLRTTLAGPAWHRSRRTLPDQDLRCRQDKV
jgi:hypothetical protein